MHYVFFGVERGGISKPAVPSAGEIVDLVLWNA
jgi:hypothetical protein